MFIANANIMRRPKELARDFIRRDLGLTLAVGGVADINPGRNFGQYYQWRMIPTAPPAGQAVAGQLNLPTSVQLRQSRDQSLIYERILSDAGLYPRPAGRRVAHLPYFVREPGESWRTWAAKVVVWDANTLQVQDRQHPELLDEFDGWEKHWRSDAFIGHQLPEAPGYLRNDAQYSYVLARRLAMAGDRQYRTKFRYHMIHDIELDSTTAPPSDQGMPPSLLSHGALHNRGR